MQEVEEARSANGDEIPPWKDSSKLCVVKELLGGDDNPDTMKKESVGVLGDDTTRVFEEDAILG